MILAWRESVWDAPTGELIRAMITKDTPTDGIGIRSGNRICNPPLIPLTTANPDAPFWFHACPHVQRVVLRRQRIRSISYNIDATVFNNLGRRSNDGAIVSLP